VKRVFLLAFALTFLGTASASAHTVLLSSNPRAGSVVKFVPSILNLKFTDPLLTLGNRPINKVVLTAPNNSSVALGPVLVHGAVISVQLLRPQTIKGRYRLSYRVSAEDGHIVTGSLTFKLQN